MDHDEGNRRIKVMYSDINEHFDKEKAFMMIPRCYDTIISDGKDVSEVNNSLEILTEVLENDGFSGHELLVTKEFYETILSYVDKHVANFNSEFFPSKSSAILLLSLMSYHSCFDDLTETDRTVEVVYNVLLSTSVGDQLCNNCLIILYNILNSDLAEIVLSKNIISDLLDYILSGVDGIGIEDSWDRVFKFPLLLLGKLYKYINGNHRDQYCKIVPLCVKFSNSRKLEIRYQCFKLLNLIIDNRRCYNSVVNDPYYFHMFFAMDNPLSNDKYNTLYQMLMLYTFFAKQKFIDIMTNVVCFDGYNFSFLICIDKYLDDKYRLTDGNTLALFYNFLFEIFEYIYRTDIFPDIITKSLYYLEHDISLVLFPKSAFIIKFLYFFMNENLLYKDHNVTEDEGILCCVSLVLSKLAYSNKEHDNYLEIVLNYLRQIALLPDGERFLRSIEITKVLDEMSESQLNKQLQTQILELRNIFT